MDTDFIWGPTKVWHCAICDSRNVTTETDVFSDQCRECTVYNELDWSDTGDVSVAEVRTIEKELRAD